MNCNINEVKEKVDYCLNCKVKPCQKGCPLGNNIPDFIKCVKEEKYEEAYDVLSKTTVLQPICGRICPHFKQCQGSCVRGIKSSPVEIGNIEAFVGDMAIKNEYKFKKTNEKKGKKVAVIGSGPTGLTCAAFLAMSGFDVDIYEKHSKLGGLLRHGIPDFRLDRDVLDKQIQKILDLGIGVYTGKELGKDYSLMGLQKDYDAVFLGFGANVSQKMKIPGEDLEGVYGGNELLENNLHPDYNGKKVAVIGGGNVAMDVSRMVRSLGAKEVYVIYRRAEEQMPAEVKEIEEAKEEGVKFLFQSNVVKIHGNQRVESIECVKTELVEDEKSDRLRPVDVEGSNFDLDVDYVMMAIGAKPEEDVANSLGLKLSNRGYIDVDEDYMTSKEGVFAGGDIIGSNGTVAWAARDGREAATAIARWLER